MANNGAEFSGKTVEEAVASGLQSLGLSQDEVDIDILNRGSRGILGFGSEPALVRISPQQADIGDALETEVDVIEAAVSEAAVSEIAVFIDEATPEVSSEAPEDVIHVEDTVVEADLEIEAVTESTDEDDVDDSNDADVSDDELANMAKVLLSELLRLMDFEADVDASWQDADTTTASPYLLLDIRGENLGALIGRRGETLSSIQYLLRLMINQQVKQWKNIVVDVEHYKQRRVDQLAQLAERMARQVAESGRSVTLEPMPGNERRIVHMTLRDNPDVFTESTGEGERRKVNIFPRH